MPTQPASVTWRWEPVGEDQVSTATSKIGVALHGCSMDAADPVTTNRHPGAMTFVHCMHASAASIKAGLMFDRSGSHATPGHRPSPTRLDCNCARALGADESTDPPKEPRSGSDLF